MKRPLELKGRLSRVLLSLLVIVSCLGLAFCVSSCGSKTSVTYSPPQEEDFSTITWTDAFDRLLQKMKTEYAFTEWKSINWDSLGAKFRPLVQKAQFAADLQQYYTTLRDFMFSIHDGHVVLLGDDQGAMKAQVGGGFGIVAMKLDDGRVIAARVTPGSPADAAGIKTGAQLTAWGGQAIAKALAATSIIFTKYQPATSTGVTYERLRYLTRAPIGAARAVTFKNPGDSAARITQLTAVDDGMDTVNFTNPFYHLPGGDQPQSMVTAKTLQGNVGYVSIVAEGELPKDKPGDHTTTAKLFKQAVDSFIKANAKGIVIDVRGNLGGSDSMVADFLSSFYKKQTLYEYQNVFNSKAGKMEIWLTNDKTGKVGNPGKSLDIVPGTPQYSGPIVAIVNTGCISSGEGVAMGVKNVPNGQVVGFWGTNGSFGMAGDNSQMPGGLTASFPFGQSLDKNKVVQIDSKNLVGGVAPTKRIPMTYENALKWGAGQDVELDYALKALATQVKSK